MAFKVEDAAGVRFANEKYDKYKENAAKWTVINIGYKFVKWHNETYGTVYEISDEDEARDLGNYILQFFLALDYKPKKEKKKVKHDYPEHIMH